MKKLITTILILALAVPSLALADLPDVTGMTDQELHDMISACSAELMARSTTEPDGTLLFEYDGFRVYQTGEAVLSGKKITIPVLMINDRDVETSVGIRDAVCNGWEIDIRTGSGLVEKSKRRDEIVITLTDDINLTSLDEIESLVFRWTATEGIMYVFKEEERTEHRFW